MNRRRWKAGVVSPSRLHAAIGALDARARGAALAPSGTRYERLRLAIARLEVVGEMVCRFGVPVQRSTARWVVRLVRRAERRANALREQLAIEAESARGAA